jgi:hypothetical protein
MADMEQLWEGQFTEAEKRGFGGAPLGPLNFKEFLQFSMQTLIRQLDEVIPEKFAKGLLSSEDTVAATELTKLLIGYEERALRSMEG